MDIKAQIEQDIKNNRIVVYMKGTADFPQCGFSAQVVNALKSYKLPIVAKNVLEDPVLRQGIKDFTEWPTIPQVFIDGQFIGGCDIIMEMQQSGELAKLINK